MLVARSNVWHDPTLRLFRDFVPRNALSTMSAQVHFKTDTFPSQSKIREKKQTCDQRVGEYRYHPSEAIANSLSAHTVMRSGMMISRKSFEGPNLCSLFASRHETRFISQKAQGWSSADRRHDGSRARTVRKERDTPLMCETRSRNPNLR